MLDTVLAISAALCATDLFANYDVLAYRLDLAVDPATKTLSGVVATEARVTADELAVVMLDLRSTLNVSEVKEIAGTLSSEGALSGVPLVFRREKMRLEIDLPTPRKKGDSFCVAVAYSGKPRARDGFAGFHWKKTPSGAPWIATSCQDEGSASWWPCKDSFFHPEDKPERVYVNATVPDGLFAVSNGKLEKREKGENVETFRWVHPYPLPTYSVTLNVAPYAVVESELVIDGSSEAVPFAYYVVPEDLEKAKVQFADVQPMLTAFTKAFGPFPFAKSKYGLVETPFWGMEHSSAIAYGSSFPAWLDEHGGEDPYAQMNELFDYILVHETAHEWWGNSVTARSWADFWLHEGFATYAELVYLEHVVDAEAVQEHFDTLRKKVDRASTLYRGGSRTSAQGYDAQLYPKGACVLHTLRFAVDDDDAWWKSLREFQTRHRHGFATTDDFRAVLEEVTKKDWKSFFDEWVRGSGYPIVEGVATARGRMLTLDFNVSASHVTTFHVPLDVHWKDGAEAKSQRVELAWGKNHIELPTTLKARDVNITGLERVLCDPHVRYE